TVGTDIAMQRAQWRFAREDLARRPDLPVIIDVICGCHAKAGLGAITIVMGRHLSFNGQIATPPLRAGPQPAVMCLSFFELSGAVTAATEHAPVVVQRRRIEDRINAEIAAARNGAV